MADSRYKALLIGNSRFPLDASLQSLEGPVNDIVALRNALTDPHAGLFEPGAVRILPERTAQDLLVELHRFFVDASRDDVLLLYYSGHGLRDTRNRLFLCASDTRTDLLKATAVGNRSINDMIDDSPAQTTIIVLDCCHSGAFKGADLAASLQGRGRFILSSCRADELANDTDRLNHTSLFTQCLVDGLLQGAADSNNDGYVVLDELYDYMHGRLETFRPRRPIPQRSFSGAGDVALARRPRPLSQPPVLWLSQTVIDFGDIQPRQELAPRRVEVRNGSLDWTAAATADWLVVERHDESFTVGLHPRPGKNHGEVVVHDRVTGAIRTVHVHAHLLQEASPPKLEVSETQIDFGTLQRGEAAPQRTVHLRNTGGGRLDAQVATSHRWLKAQQRDDLVILSIATSAAGRLAGQVDINSQGGSAHIHVTAVVEPNSGTGRAEFKNRTAGAMPVTRPGLTPSKPSRPPRYGWPAVMRQIPWRITVLAVIVLLVFVGIVVWLDEPRTQVERPGDMWATAAPLPTPRIWISAATGLDGRIYVPGGFDDERGHLRTLEVYDPDTDTWKALAPMPTARSYAGVTADGDGRIYVVGGFSSSGVLDRVEVYDTDRDTWVTAAPMPTPRFGLAAVTGPDGRIYAIGGNDNTHVFDIVEVYDPRSGAWTRAAPMSLPRYGFAAAAGRDGRIYAVGGYGDPSAINSLEVYDASTDRWQTGAQMPTPRGTLAATRGQDGRIYVVGGFADLRTMEVYDPAANSWDALAPMPTGRDALAAATGSDGRIYAIGGGNQYERGEVEAYTP